MDTKPMMHSPRIQLKSHDVTGVFKGYASVFNHLDHQGDRVLKGAFSRSLQNWQRKKQMPKMLWQHDPTKPIGQWLKIVEDQKGLYVEGKLLLDLQLGREAYTLVQAGVVNSLSIGYQVEEAKTTPSGERHLVKVTLQEISLVTFAANSEACVIKRDTFNHQNDDEAILQAICRAKAMITT